MGSNAGSLLSASAAALGGRLMTLIGDRDTARFSCEVSGVCTEPHQGGARPEYGNVLAWVVKSILDGIGDDKNDVK
ncbi:hypothetical protein [Rhodococcus opacus]|uniref:hypothetical protein n=1 Tax=Rhodococcus opacus TaxID=37919 RepID=UPI002948F5AB|nr:hypothetical protein [Rhodococcus opacus]MDV6244843.1 hypothetical protein [Rhodococcus opacus]